MLPRLDRYLAKEILLPFGAALLFLTQLLLATQILARADILFGAGVSLLDLGGVILALTPHLMGYVLPVSFLLGAILGTGRLADDREIMAIGAAGLSPVRLVRVPLLIGAALAALGLWLSVEVEPAGLREAEARFNEIIKNNVTANVRAGTFFDEIPQFTVYAGEVGKEGWRDVLISDRTDPSAPVLALARRGRLEAVGRGEEMRLVLEDGEVHREEARAEEYVTAAFRKAEIALGLGTTISDRNVLAGSTKAMTMAELAERAAPGSERTEGQRLAYLVAYHRRLASPLAVLAFALMAVPIAAMRKGGRAAGLGATVAGVLAHFLLLRGGEVLAEKRLLPPALAMQLSTVVLLAVGLGLVWVLHRRGPGAVR
jgi:lipopolysaccharide export system permease protein